MVLSIARDNLLMLFNAVMTLDFLLEERVWRKDGSKTSMPSTQTTLFVDWEKWKLCLFPSTYQYSQVFQRLGLFRGATQRRGERKTWRREGGVEKGMGNSEERERGWGTVGLREGAGEEKSSGKKGSKPLASLHIIRLVEITVVADMIVLRCRIVFQIAIMSAAGREAAYRVDVLQPPAVPPRRTGWLGLSRRTREAPRP